MTAMMTMNANSINGNTYASFEVSSGSAMIFSACAGQSGSSAENKMKLLQNNILAAAVLSFYCTYWAATFLWLESNLTCWNYSVEKKVLWSITRAIISALNEIRVWCSW